VTSKLFVIRSTSSPPPLRCKTKWLRSILGLERNSDRESLEMRLLGFNFFILQNSENTKIQWTMYTEMNWHTLLPNTIPVCTPVRRFNNWFFASRASFLQLWSWIRTVNSHSFISTSNWIQYLSNLNSHLWQFFPLVGHRILKQWTIWLLGQ
jgi:hypothetical protein